MTEKKAPRVVKVDCPFCRGVLEVDAETGDVLGATEHAPQRKDFDEALGDVRSEQEMRDELFSRAFESEKRRGELLAKKFERVRGKTREDGSNDRDPLDDL